MAAREQVVSAAIADVVTEVTVEMAELDRGLMEVR
jgi:hypothetical protein